ncbi:hypothetical protein KQI65_07030 [bacterium]|nr:hypothetical protein [bacterium]
MAKGLRFIGLVYALLLLATSAYAQEQLHPLEFSCDGVTMDIGNPTDAPITIRGMWLFGETTEYRRSNLDLRITIEPKTIKTVTLKDLGLARKQWGAASRPVKVAFHARCASDEYMISYYELNDEGHYRLNSESSEMLTGYMKQVPGWSQIWK